MAIFNTPEYSTMLFTDIWDNAEDFANEYLDSPLVALTEDSITKLFYLLYAKYGNNPIANRSINQFKYKVFAIMFQYGPAWEKRLDIQSKLRELTEADLLAGAKVIHNHAFNPSSDPSTAALEELKYINEQNSSNSKRSKLDAYAMLNDLIKNDVTEEFLNRFKPLFKVFARPENPLLFVTENDDEEGEQ